MLLKDKVFNPQSETFLYFFKARIDMLKKNNIEPIFVFDGKMPLIKQPENCKREAARIKYFKVYQIYLRTRMTLIKKKLLQA